MASEYGVAELTSTFCEPNITSSLLLALVLAEVGAPGRPMVGAEPTTVLLLLLLLLLTEDL